jgi:hypothetical protein
MKAEASLSNEEFAKCERIHPHFYRVLCNRIIAVLWAAGAREAQALSRAKLSKELLERLERQDLTESLVRRKLPR